TVASAFRIARPPTAPAVGSSSIAGRNPTRSESEPTRGGAMASPARCENNTYAPSTEARTAGGTTSRMTADSGPLYQEERKNVPNSKGTNNRRSSTSSSAAHTGPPSTNPAPDTTTRPPLQRASSQSPTRPPNSPPSAAPANPHRPTWRPTAATDSPCVRSRKLGAQAIRPFTANVTNAPPTNIQISVGVRSTVAAACTKSPSAVAATSPASVVARAARGITRITVHTTPTLTLAANTAVSRPGGTRRWNRSRTPLASAPATVSHTSGRPRRSAWRSPPRPRTYHPAMVARIEAGGRRRGSRNRAASAASTNPGAPSATNATRHPYRSASTPPSQIPVTPPNAIPTEYTPIAKAR